MEKPKSCWECEYRKPTNIRYAKRMYKCTKDKRLGIDTTFNHSKRHIKCPLDKTEVKNK